MKTHPKSSQSKRIGNYRILKELGEGTFGKVKLAVHQATSEKVAIKILHKSKILDSSDIDRITREIQILKLIRHPGLIQLYEIIETPQKIYLVMEFASGGDLFEYISSKTTLPEPESCLIFQQILSSIEYLHRLQIAHRDIKPENLLLDSTKRIKLADFGLSNQYKPGNTLRTACGSPCYAAPEMVAGKKYCPLSVDIYSCGIVLYVMLTGNLPFDHPNTTILYKKIMAGDYAIPETVSPQARELISGMLATDPRKRFSIAQIKAGAWYMLVSQRIEEGIIVGYQKIPVDRRVIDKLREYNIDVEAAVKAVEGCKHNSLTAAYYLVEKRKRENSEGIQRENEREVEEAGSDNSFLQSVNRHVQAAEMKMFRIIECQGIKKRERKEKVANSKLSSLPDIKVNTPNHRKGISVNYENRTSVQTRRTAVYDLNKTLDMKRGEKIAINNKNEAEKKVITKNFKITRRYDDENMMHVLGSAF